MNRSLWARLKQSLNAAERWYRTTPERALEEAFDAAKAIQLLERQFAGGKTISIASQGDGAVSAYFQTEIKQYLKTIRVRLYEYRFSRFWAEQGLSAAERRGMGQRMRTREGFGTEYTLSADQYSTEAIPEIGPEPDIFKKLQFIDSVLIRYEPWRLPASEKPTPPRKEKAQSPTAIASVQDSFMDNPAKTSSTGSGVPKQSDSSFIPRSILKTADRFRRELDPNPEMEEEVVRDFRTSQQRTRAATRFLLLLIIVPLLTQQISKVVLFGPIVERLQKAEQIEEWVNPRIEDRFLNQFAAFEERLKFQNLVAPTPMTPGEMNLALQAKALDIKEELKETLKEPAKNILADFLSLIVFSILIVTGRREIETLKSLIDEIVYGLSDSAKAFIIILFTDVFVGFHSPHGWEVIMESTLDHFGLPLDQSFVNMFIATFPVMLDTVFKYWIFRYLNQISPSAVATYRNMNE